jgi:hypothetical protein
MEVPVLYPAGIRADLKKVCFFWQIVNFLSRLTICLTLGEILMSCNTIESRRFPTVAALLTVALATLITSQAMAQPGSAIITVPLAVPGNGVSVANNCEGEIYYTHTDAVLYKTDAAGADLGSVLIVDAAGAPVAIDEMAWDESRQILWGQEHDSNPVDVYTINATTGAAAFAFTATNTVSVGSFRDGIAYDASDDSLWLTGDVSTTVEHYTTGGAFLGQITPTDAAGGTLGLISGVSVGVGDLLYLGRNGAVEIVQVTKSTGAFITSFASPAGTRDEGLECDAFSFAPTLALWSREFNSPGDITAIEIEPGSCECGGGAILTCTLGFWKNHPEEWTTLDPDDMPAWGGGLTYMEIFNTAPKKGDASVMLAHSFIAATLNTGADPADLAAAFAMLTTHPVGSGDLTGKSKDPDRAVALAIHEDLQDFNESTECSL